jgi:membrane protein DedA with SNARE-associated domain
MLLHKIKKFFLGALFEWSIVIFFLIYLFSYSSIGLPSANEFILVIQNGFETYGLIFLFVGLMLEGLFVFGLYFPGSAIAIMAVITLGRTHNDVFAIILVGVLAMLAITTVNYLLGKYGYYKVLEKLGAKGSIERMGNRFRKNEKGVILLFSSSPNSLAICSIYAGIVQANFIKYMKWVGTCLFFWISLVSALVFIFLRDYDLASTGNVQWYAFGILVAWALFESIVAWRQKIKS